MARLSNPFRSGDGAPSDDAGRVLCRPAHRAEIEPALRLLLADASGLAGDDAVLDFLSFAVHRRIDVNATWVAEHARRIVWAILPIVSPGRTMLLFTSGRLPGKTPPQAVRLLADAVCRYYGAGARPVALAQLLLDPDDRTVHDLYRRTGFEDLAELIYLQKSVHRASDPEPLSDAAGQLVNYAPDAHALFADTIARSYEGSLDCPALNGRRDVEDVIAGHQATGAFDPSMWFALRDPSGAGRAVLLLNPTAASDSVELVYLGLVPAARGLGVGDALMRLAAATAARREFRELALAVDARNAPALRLYHRHGMRQVGSRLALVRDLRAARDARAPVHDVR